MGHSHWSDAAYQNRQNHRRAGKRSAFDYDRHVRATGQACVHPQMDPFGKIRESRDSPAHPESLAIAVVFDVTGSMGTVPRVLQTRLGQLMRMLIEKGYVAHPHMLFGAVGDAYTDRVPLQIGQFEAGLEMDDDLGKIYLEGGGGGQVHESYELALYYFARRTAIDCYEKRGEKGYLFSIGDELPYATLRRRHVQQHIGDFLEVDLPVEQVVTELGERYEHFHIIPTSTSHGRNPKIQRRWQELLGERVLLLEDETAVSETIALTIGLCEGRVVDVAAGLADLAAAGADRAAGAAAGNAVQRYAAVRPRPAGLLPPETGIRLR
jgi:hypothetical protein